MRTALSEFLKFTVVNREVGSGLGTEAEWRDYAVGGVGGGKIEFKIFPQNSGVICVYLVNAWTIAEQSVGELAITTIGSAISTSSHSRWTCDSTQPRLRNRSTSCTEPNSCG